MALDFKNKFRRLEDINLTGRATGESSDSDLAVRTGKSAGSSWSAGVVASAWCGQGAGPARGRLFPQRSRASESEPALESPQAAQGIGAPPGPGSPRRGGGGGGLRAEPPKQRTTVPGSVPSAAGRADLEGRSSSSKRNYRERALRGGGPKGRSGPQGSLKGRPGLPAGQTGGDRRSSTLPTTGGPVRVAVSPLAASACAGAGRSVPARHLAAGPPEIKKKENCASVCANPVGL